MKRTTIAAKVWNVCRGKDRDAAIAACIAAGINRQSAPNHVEQYQQWLLQQKSKRQQAKLRSTDG